MDRDDLVRYFFIFIFIVVPFLKGLYKNKKNNPLPQNREDFEQKYRLKEPIRQDNIKPVGDIEPKRSLRTTKQNEALSKSFKPGYSLESKIESKHLSSNIEPRHIKSKLEALSHQKLLQERFAKEIAMKEKRNSLAKALTHKSKIKEAFILSEILKRRF